MKATELRIGNWLKRLDDSEFQVTANDIMIISKWSNPFAILPSGIPLTEEWLLKFGFKRNGYSFEKGMIWFRFWNDKRGRKSLPNACAVNKEEISYELQYVHQLQNLYYALTGEELNTK